MSQRYSSGLSPLWKVLTRIAVAVDQKIGWDKLPLPVALLVLIALRRLYRWTNLYDTSRLPTVGVLELVEAARNEHLARLDAEDGLQALLVAWSDVALLVAEMSLGRRHPVRRTR